MRYLTASKRLCYWVLNKESSFLFIRNTMWICWIYWIMHITNQPSFYSNYHFLFKQNAILLNLFTTIFSSCVSLNVTPYISDTNCAVVRYFFPDWPILIMQIKSCFLNCRWVKEATVVTIAFAVFLSYECKWMQWMTWQMMVNGM